MSDYPSQSRRRGSWPDQPPPYSRYEQGPDGYPTVPRRRRGRRAGAWLLAVLLLLVAAFVVGDQVAKSYAQNKIAQQIQDQANLAARPSVNIEGFPFLTQVAAHELHKVDISARNVAEGRLTISSITATATGVHLNSSFSGATIDQIGGTALITFASLESAAGAKGVTITADPGGGPGAIAVSAGHLASAKGQIKQTGPSQFTVKINSLGGLAGLAAGALGALPDYVINIPTLPAGLKVDGVSVSNQGIVVRAAAQHTTLSQ